MSNSKYGISFWILIITNVQFFGLSQGEDVITIQSTNEDILTTSPTTDVEDIEQSFFEDNANSDLSFEPSVDCKEHLCVRKCCKSGAVFDMLTGCVDITASDHVNITGWWPTFGAEADTSNLVLLYGNPPKPKTNRSCFVHEEREFFLQKDGNLFWKGEKKLFSHDYYCIDKMVKGISVQFFTLSFYFWLNVMCYEISRIIRGSVSLIPLRPLRGANRRYLYYSLYAYGMPLIISIVTCAIQYLPEGLRSSVETFVVRSDGEERCWFIEQTGGIFAYFYDIEIFLHVVNSVLMAHSSILLHRDKLACICCQKNTSTPPEPVPGNENHVALFWQQLSIFAMYVFIWGLNCVALIYSGEKFWKVIDIIVTLQGLFLFIIVTRTEKGSLMIQACENLSIFSKRCWSRVFGSKKTILISSTPKLSSDMESAT